MKSSTASEQLAVLVNHVKENPDGKGHLLVPLLSERHPLYRDQSTKEVARMRGYAMAAMRLTGLPNRALPYVLECLESEFHPYLIAAAARSLRGVESPHPEIANYLVKAIYNIWEHDNPISFDSYQIEWPLKNFTTALTEIFETLAHFGIFARPVLSDLEHLLQHCAHKFDMHVQVKLSKAIGAIKEDQREIESGCCKDFVLFDEQEESSEQATPGDVRGDLVLQDQDGSRITWNEFFAHKPTILAFFYTRCSNPRKCTQTIIGLATIQKRLIEIGFNGKVRVAAISYDPKFDSPGALKSYGNARKFIFNDDSCMFRVQEDFDEVIRAFRLGVNFNGSQVNSHRIELFLLGSNGNLIALSCDSKLIRKKLSMQQFRCASRKVVCRNRMTVENHL